MQSRVLSLTKNLDAVQTGNRVLSCDGLILPSSVTAVPTSTRDGRPRSDVLPCLTTGLALKKR